MTLETVFYVFTNLAEIYGGTKELTVENFNEYLQLADFDFLRECRREDESKLETMVTEALRPFRHTDTVALTAGSGSLPSGFYYDKRIAYDNSGSNRRVKRLTDEEWEEYQQNSVLAPSSDYPVCIIDNGSIEVLPATITSISLTYIKMNVGAEQPKLAFTLTNGVNTYDDDNSVALKWDEIYHIDIIRHMLKYIGISLNNIQIAQYVDEQQRQDR